MSLFELQDVRIAIGSIATLDLPMVVDLIGIYGLKGPYCTLTTTNWFLQALSVIPRGSWGDVARCFTMHKLSASPPLHIRRRSRPPCAAAAARLRRKIVSGQFEEENPFVLISSVLLVQADEGVSFLVVDRIGDIYQSTEKSRRYCNYGWSQAQIGIRKSGHKPPAAACDGAYMHTRARAKPLDRPAHSLRTAADSWPLLHVRLSHIAGQSLREVCAKLRAAGCGGVARWSRFRPMVRALEVGDDGRRFVAGYPLECARALRRLAHDRRWSAQPVAREVGRWLAAGRWLAVGRWLRAAAAASFFLWWRRRCRPPLRRVSSDVMTVGLISSRVWFGPVPGSP
ncbi:hypothetical protein F511_38848 [Dorcoceras hygrometricum]|uniref:Uncharacterized protein n=1 Tax=Dorcoceras hygrometricum TaxID=472368 RepID=A0A2Z7A2V5_9LAMI|nr:hypothetical protein F511_38848 [Dorcoceras hygrometricum]